MHTEDVDEVDLSTRPFVVRSAERELRTHSIVIATGATAMRLGLPSEHTFWSRGISACAICDGASPLFKALRAPLRPPPLFSASSRRAGAVSPSPWCVGLTLSPGTNPPCGHHRGSRWQWWAGATPLWRRRCT